MLDKRHIPFIKRLVSERPDDPTRVDYRAANQRVALVLVHGFSGNTKATWADLVGHLLADSSLRTWDVFALGYPSSLRVDVPNVWAADPNLATIARGLRTALSLPPFDRYRCIAIAAHSMGGLVVQRAVLDDTELRGRLSHLFLFGTPSGGLIKARLFAALKRQIGDMRAEGPFITALRRDWNRHFGSSTPFYFRVIAGDRDEFVPPSSSLEVFPEEVRDVVPGNHLEIVKPPRRDHLSVSLVASALRGSPRARGVVDGARLAVELGDFRAVVSALLPQADELDDAAVGSLALALDSLGRGREALEILERCCGGGRLMSTDALGILAGRIKRRWLVNRAAIDLARAKQLYADGLQRAEAEENPDYESGRTLDLDATYETIIHPATVDLDFRCIRADEIMHSGVIDTEMYEMLLRADLVIADISTGNVNAMYELGVRHALRPFSTIVMSEVDGKLHFDLNHVNTFHYKHLGEDIGAREAERAKRELRALIAEVMAVQKPDSPVYTYLPKLQQPRLTEEEYAELLDETEAAQERLAGFMRSGEQAFKESRPLDAARAFAAAAEMKPGEPYIVQQRALATYKTKAPSELDALITGLGIIAELDPDHSNDPETLGITGAMRKRLWLLTNDLAQLDAAVRFYGRGFEVRRDYYNGENLAVCYDFRAAVQTDPAEAQYDRMSARKVRLVLIDLLTDAIASPSFEDRYDRRWVFATLANCSFALGRTEEGDRHEAAFLAESPAAWELESYNAGKTAVTVTHSKSSDK